MSTKPRRALTTPPVDGVVLAAGRSRRIGQSKPLLRVDGETFLERAVRRLAAGGCRTVSVVAGSTDEPVRRLARALGAAIVVNPETGSEQIHSVRLAVANLPPDSGAMVVLPVDYPLVAAKTVAALIEAYIARRALIVVPCMRDEHGHPVLIARPLFRSITEDALPEGVRSLIELRSDRLEAVPVDDEGTLLDIDTAEQYERLVARGSM